MERIFHYQVTKNEAGEKLGNYLRSRGYSRHILHQLKETEQGILLNGAPAFLTVRLREQDKIRIRLLETAPSTALIPTPLSFEIVYEDEDLLVINKPSDMPIHPSFGNHGNTLADGLSWYFSQKGVSFVFRCINRLDRDTTGLLIVAKHSLSASILSSMSARREIHREYLAIVKGVPPLKGTIHAPIGRKEGSAILREVNFQTGENAVTHFRRMDEKNGLSLVSLTLETGRTHQIRVHMGYLGFPLIGDYLYYPDHTLIQRQALHSCRLSFLHPISQRPMEFTAPLPEDMARLFKEYSL